MRPARLDARCQRAVTTIPPGAMVDADTSLPLLVNGASLRADARDRVEDTQRFSAALRSDFGVGRQALPGA
ncbi:hypothetical protein W7U_21140 [Mycobacterium sp. H4Y]|nr:hypothetical protein W7U_21140 [Mycobacterium sp. H4Y]ETZ26045.1 hypothetical protein L842_5346 [Mycobacterium intracellulare MIN_052511_1280]